MFRLAATLICLILTLSSTASRAGLMEATSTVIARCEFIRDEFSAVPREASAGCTHSGLNRISSAAVATGFGGIFPEVGSVVASSSISRGEVFGAFVDAGAAGTVTYYAALEAVAPPPFAPLSIPLKFYASGTVNTAGSAGDAFLIGSAEAHILSIEGAGLGVRLDGPGMDTFKGFIPVSFAFGEHYPVLVGAGCDLKVGGQNTFASCTAAVDPSFSFDQEAFDAMHPESFLLEDFFGITYSPNVIFEAPPVGIPEPPLLALFGGALALLRLCVGRRRRRD